MMNLERRRVCSSTFVSSHAHKSQFLKKMGTSVSSVLKQSAVRDVGIQMFMWALSSFFQTERFYDLTGSATFVYLAINSYRWGSKVRSSRQTIQTSLVVIWAVRLGLFLFSRVLHDGHDRRFNHVRDNPKVFLIYWLVQALWIFLTILPTLIVNGETRDVAIGPRDYAGWGLWGMGMFLEVLADYQKTVFKSQPENAGRFINSGLWSISRHPNYMGEILLWSGLYISSTSVLTGWQHLGVISPLFIYALLTRVSGIPILERIGLKKWGTDPDYLKYIKTVPVLFPLPGL